MKDTPAAPSPPRAELAHAPHQGHAHHPHPPEGDAGGAPERVRDPVCGMLVDPHTTSHRQQHAGRPYYFCSAGCQAKFADNPAKFLAPSDSAPPQAVPEGTIYTCPMHPQIRQLGPGSCPICGMALEPELVTAASAPNPELVDMTRRFWLGLALALPVVDPRDGRPSRQPAYVHRSEVVELAAVRPRDSGGAVGGLAVLRARLAIPCHAQSQHVHPHCHGHRGGVDLQRRGDPVSRPFPTRVPRPRRHGRRLFRGRCGHHRAGAAGAGARAARARADVGRHPRAARPRPQDRPARPRRRQRRGGFARRDRGRRPAARAARRQDPGRRRDRSRDGRPSTSRWSRANRCR